MLTPQELEKLKKRLAVKPLNISGSQELEPKEPGYFERLGAGYKQAAEDVVAAVTRPAQSAAAGASPLEVGGQLVETGLRTVGEVAGAAFLPITEALSPVVKPLVEKIVQIPGVKEGVGKIAALAEQHPEVAKDLEAILNIAILGLGKTAEPVLKQAISSTAKVGAKGTEIAGKGLKEAGVKSYGLGIPLEQATARAVQAYQATKPTLLERISSFFTGDAKKVATAPITEAETAARVGLSGTEWQIGVQAKSAASKLWDDAISPALGQSKKKINMRAFFNDLEKRIIAETPELSRRNALKEALGALREDFAKVGEISLKKLQEYKSGWAKFVPERVYKGKPISGALNEVRNMAAQEARSEIYQTLGQNIKQAYLDYGNLQSIIEAGIKSVDALRSKGMTKQVWEFLVDKTVTPIATYGGKVLYRTGEGLEFVGKEGLKKLGDLLKN